MIRIVFIVLFFSTFSTAQKKQYILDIDGSESNFQALFMKHPNNSMEFRVKKDSGKVFQISAPKYEIYKVNHDIVLENISKIKKEIHKDSLTYLIQYFYKDDTTFLDEENNFLDKNGSYLKFIINMKRNVEKINPNIKVLFVFEKGIDISIVGKRKSFIIDEDLFFKNQFLKKSILCGSFLLIKPNGELLVRNGEYRLDKMAEHLNPEIWDTIFKL